MKTTFQVVRRVKQIFFSALILFAVLFSGCEGDDDPDPLTGGLEALSYPLSWLLTIDHSTTEYKYLYVPGYIGTVILRGTVDKTYSLNNLADEKDCVWEVTPNGKSGIKTVYSFYSKENPSAWWEAGITYGVGGAPEWYLGIDETSSKPDSDNHKFFLHEMPDVDKKKTFAIECVAKPGYYLHNTGHTLSGNGLQFVAASSPEGATRFTARTLGGATIGM
jgi:hypothetical protein